MSAFASSTEKRTCSIGSSRRSARSRQRRKMPIATSGSPTIADAPAQLPEQLQGRDSHARFDPRDVGGRAAGERKLPLAQPGAFARVAQPPPDGDGIVDVG